MKTEIVRQPPSGVGSASMGSPPMRKGLWLWLASFLSVVLVASAAGAGVPSPEVADHNVAALAQEAANQATDRKPHEVMPHTLKDVFHETVDGHLVEIASGRSAQGSERLYVLVLTPDPEIVGEWLPSYAIDTERNGMPIALPLQLGDGGTYVAYADLAKGHSIRVRTDKGDVEELVVADAVGLVKTVAAVASVSVEPVASPDRRAEGESR